MLRTYMALALVISSAVTSFITYDFTSYEGGHANLIAFTLSMYVLSFSVGYCAIRMRSIIK